MTARERREAGCSRGQKRLERTKNETEGIRRRDDDVTVRVVLKGIYPNLIKHFGYFI